MDLAFYGQKKRPSEEGRSPEMLSPGGLLIPYITNPEANVKPLVLKLESGRVILYLIWGGYEHGRAGRGGRPPKIRAGPCFPIRRASAELTERKEVW